MSKKCCLIHANCQGEPLIAALRKHPEFSRAFDVRLVLNYVREPLGAEDMASCDLFLHQHLGEKWGELSSAHLLSLAPAHCETLCIPNMFFKGYWPLWSGKPGFDFRDQLLDQLLEMGLGRTEILHVYLGGDLGAKFDLEDIFARSIATERTREAFTPIKYLDGVLETFRDMQLFTTVNHPSPDLLRLTADAILDQLGMPPMPDSVPHETLHPEFVLPIHPGVAAFHNLTFADAQTRYPVYGAQRTFAEYAADYVDCRLAGIDDFIAFLQTRADLLS